MTGALAALLPALWLAAAGDPVVATASPAPAAPVESIWAPPQPREVTRVELRLSPFLGVPSSSWGGVGEARLEHYFRAPFMLGLELAPLAVVSSGSGPGALAQARVHGAYVNDYFAIGLGVGGQLQRFGRNGLSVAPTLRLGSLDGLHLSVEYAYTRAPNRYTGQPTTGFSDVLANLAIPLTRRLTLEFDGGLALQAWAYTTIGLRHRLVGDGGPGTWFISGALGGAWLTDRGGCNYTADLAVPCAGSAVSFGPTISFGLERRF
jgi:hypothetical protein